MVAEARSAFQQGNTRLASILLKNVMRVAPTHAAAQLLLSQVLVQAGDLTGAERTLREARNAGAPDAAILPALLQVMLVRGKNRELLEEFPDPAAKVSPVAADILKARAFAHQGLGRPAEASAAMDRSLQLRRDGQGLLAKARLTQIQGNVSAAKTLADQALQIDPKNFEAALFKINLLRALNENAAALDLANKLLAANPENLRARLVRIEIFLSRNEDQKAKSEIDALLARYPKMTAATYYRALLLERVGKHDEAWISAQNLPSEFVQSNPRIGLAVVKIAMAAGKMNAAEGILGRLVGRWPDDVSARVQLAAIRLEQTSFNSALSILEPLKGSTDPTVLKLLARAYAGVDRTKEATAALQRLGPGPANGEAAARQQALQELQNGRAEVAIKLLRPLVAKDPVNFPLASALIGALMQTKQYKEALAAADRLGADPKQKAAALIYKADILALQNNRKAAKAAFDQAVASASDKKAALLARANFLTVTRSYGEAAKDLQAAASLDPKDYQPLLRLAAISSQQGQDSQARAFLRKAIDAAPQAEAPRLTMARYLLDRRDAAGAMAVANDLVRLQPSNGEAFALKGRVEMELGKPKEAVQSFRRFAALAPNSAPAQLMLSEALSKAGDQQGATAAMDAAMKINPYSPDVRSAQVNLLLAQGKTEDAITQAIAFQKFSPGPAADIALSAALVKAERIDEAAKVLEKSFSGNANSAVLQKLVPLLFLTKNTAKAQALMAQWLKSHPDDLAIRLQYADLLMRSNQLPNAQAQYEAVLNQDANNLLAINNLGWLIQTSDPKRALEILSRGEKLAPGSADIADTLGWIMLRQKDAAGALSHLERAHNLHPADEQISYHYALALDANGKRGPAREVLGALLAKTVNSGLRAEAQKLYNGWR